VLLGRTWGKALAVVDQSGVQCYEAETSKRRLYQVCHLTCMRNRKGLCPHPWHGPIMQ
jgi:hypothetical protein